MDQSSYDRAREIFVVASWCMNVLWFVAVIYNYSKFQNATESIMIQKRYPNIIRHQVLFIIMILVIVGPFMTLSFSHLARFSESTQLIFTRINRGVYPCFTFPFFTFIAWRFWHCFYGLQYSSTQKDETWQFHLDPALVETNFWLKNSAKLGNIQYTTRYVYRIVIIGASLDALLYQFCIGTHAIYFAIFIDLALHSIPATLILVFWWKLPQYVDHFYIRDEIRYTAWVLLGVNGLVVVFFTFGIIIGDLVIGLMGAIFICLQMVGTVSMIMLRWSRNKAIEAEKKLIANNSNNVHDFNVSELLLNPITFRVRSSSSNTLRYSNVVTQINANIHRQLYYITIYDFVFIGCTYKVVTDVLLI